MFYSLLPVAPTLLYVAYLFLFYSANKFVDRYIIYLFLY